MINSHIDALEQSHTENKKSIKCVVWDLDNTIWDGILVEQEEVTLREGVVDIIKTLDQRGILQSIASTNDYHSAMEQLEQFGLTEYFLYPQIRWSAKSSSLKEISRSLNIGSDTLAFIDDQSFELEEVAYELPEVLCLEANMLDKLLSLPEMLPRFLTEDSHQRRLMYISDSKRKEAERDFVGPNEDFLATLGMVFTIAPAGPGDLQRAEELTIRTHQLNTTGYSYSYEELDRFRTSNRYQLFVAGLDDKYGTYGKIGLALVECLEDIWTVKLLLMSCRVMSRGVGTILMSHILRLACQAKVRLLAEFIPNEKNRMMFITYKFAGFKEMERKEELVLLTHDLTQIQTFPAYMQVHCE